MKKFDSLDNIMEHYGVYASYENIDNIDEEIEEKANITIEYDTENDCFIVNELEEV